MCVNVVCIVLHVLIVGCTNWFVVFFMLLVGVLNDCCVLHVVAGVVFIVCL